jgi:hypothetical protein
MEGKTLIVKTFGGSQIIFDMQSSGFKNYELTNTKRIIIKFLWSTNEIPNGIDKIKQTIIKNNYSEGWIKFIDAESLDRSLKLSSLELVHRVKLRST